MILDPKKGIIQNAPSEIAREISDIYDSLISPGQFTSQVNAVAISSIIACAYWISVHQVDLNNKHAKKLATNFKISFRNSGYNLGIFVAHSDEIWNGFIQHCEDGGNLSDDELDELEDFDFSSFMMRMISDAAAGR